MTGGRDDEEEITQVTMLNMTGSEVLKKATEVVERANVFTEKALRELCDNPEVEDHARERIASHHPPRRDDTQVVLRPISAPQNGDLRQAARLVLATAGVIDLLWLAKDGHRTMFIVATSLERTRDIRLCSMLMPFCDACEVMTASVKAQVSGAVSLASAWRDSGQR